MDLAFLSVAVCLCYLVRVTESVVRVGLIFWVYSIRQVRHQTSAQSWNSGGGVQLVLIGHGGLELGQGFFFPVTQSFRRFHHYVKAVDQGT